MTTRTPLTTRITSHAPGRGRLHGTGLAHRVALGLVVGTSTLLLPGVVLAHEEAPLPYPEPADSTPQMNTEVLQESPTFLYFGIGLVAIGILASLFVVISRRNTQQPGTGEQ